MKGNRHTKSHKKKASTNISKKERKKKTDETEGVRRKKTKNEKINDWKEIRHKDKNSITEAKETGQSEFGKLKVIGLMTKVTSFDALHNNNAIQTVKRRPVVPGNILTGIGNNL